MDLVIRCRSLPRAGETLAAKSSTEVCGGKGANQAVAAAKAGGQVRMIGRVGSDSFALRLLDNLRVHDVNCDGVCATQAASGLAIVAVEDSGQNAILLVAGANSEMSAEDVSDNQQAIATADVLLLQLEVPTESVLAAIRVAQAAGVRCIVDPAPVASEWNDALLQVDLVCPNETEAATITGLPVETIADAEIAARQLHQRGAQNVAITLGDRGVVLLMDNTLNHIPACSVQAVDTTAAGDGFAGALAVRWAETDDLLESVRFASFAGAIAATRLGAQPSLAGRAEIELLRSRSGTVGA